MYTWSNFLNTEHSPHFIVFYSCVCHSINALLFNAHSTVQSVAAGIPDFRSPGTGLYDNLQKYQLPFPEAIFEMEYFRQKPQPFFTLAREMLPVTFNLLLFLFFSFDLRFTIS